MNTQRSLSTFFAETEETTLENCDREAIHLMQSIQARNGLLVVNPISGKIVGASENIHEFLGRDLEFLLGTPLQSVNVDLSDAVSHASILDSDVLHEALDFNLSVRDTAYDAITHVHDGLRFIEFTPNLTPSDGLLRRKMRQCSTACTRIMQSDDIRASMQVAVDAVREITGYSRVMIYRFLHDWSGKVISESRTENMTSFLGLHFPASDIPKQAREIMRLVPARTIGSTSDDKVRIVTLPEIKNPLDLTRSISRSVSRMHTAYLRNMEVGATFYASLMHEGNLWGIISAHNDTPGAVPFDCWSLVQEIGTALMLRQIQLERLAVAEKIAELRRIENKFAAALRIDGDVERVIHTLVPILQEFLRADGFAFQYGTKLHLSGRTPPAEFVPQLIAWAMEKQEAEDQFQTSALHREWAPALEHKETACGVLVQPIIMHRVCQLIWFRGPITRKVKWAGEPKPKTDPNDPLSCLSPRTSFDTWIEEHSEESEPWHVSELESAREIFKEFLDLITAQMLLKEENASLRQFASAAAHDLKAPLRGITMALDMMSEEEFDEKTVKETHAYAKNSAKRLSDLTNGLLELSLIRDKAHTFERVDLNKIGRDCVELLSAEIEDLKATVTIDALPSIEGNENLLMRLFLNLVGNGLKYRNAGQAPKLHIHVLNEALTHVELAFADNGIGVDPKYAERIFRPMQRLHAQSEIEGTGLGLTICDRIAKAHGGSIYVDPDYTDGACFIVHLLRQQRRLDAIEAPDT